MNIIDGRALAEKIKDDIALEVFEAVKNGETHPSLAIVLVGTRPDSKLYVSLKEREAKKLGIDTYLYELDEAVSELELTQTIEFLNKDNSIDSILVQLPLPENFDTDKIMSKLDPKKDADGFLENHPKNVMSPVLAAIKLMLENTKITATKLTAGALYNSEVFGGALKKILTDFGFKEVIGITGKKAGEVKDISSRVDVLITAIGVPLFIKDNMIKDQAVIIDVGTTRVGTKVCGDVDFDSVKDKVSFISPVPGGIGPMTIAFLFKNVLSIYKNKKTA
ncbi:MAG: bifunctional 5,10-methylenetetrahydrofolate dehydrogenase/5,10-methenyltetrahydrofolate cyclohydrolase [Candidatus Falkowbacteria bacterium]